MYVYTYVHITYTHTTVYDDIEAIVGALWLQGLKEQLEESQVDKLKLRGALSALKEDADSSM